MGSSGRVCKVERGVKMENQKLVALFNELAEEALAEIKASSVTYGEALKLLDERFSMPKELTNAELDSRTAMLSRDLNRALRAEVREQLKKEVQGLPIVKSVNQKVTKEIPTTDKTIFSGMSFSGPAVSREQYMNQYADYVKRCGG